MKPTRTKVIIINGVQRSGKDTFVEFVESYCSMDESANVLNLSSVDLIKGALYDFGWDGDKTDEVRDIIAGIKKIWINAQNGPTMFMMNNILAFHMAHTGEDNIVFCHIREPEEIDKLVCTISGMETMGIEIMTMLIVRKENIKDDNTYDTVKRLSDNFDIISQYPYDHIIYNDEDLASFDAVACAFVDKLF